MKLSQREEKRIRERYGPWAVVTGASSGIGRELARTLADCGVNLMLAARRENPLSEVSREARAAGVEARTLPVDLGAPAGVAALLDAARDMDVGLLVAAAGFGSGGPFLQSNLRDELDMIQVNCSALLALTHHFAPRFRARGRGGILLLSSMVAFQGAPYAANYAATKAYVQSLAEALHVELKPQGVDVLAAAPGPTRSGFAERANMQMGLALEARDMAAPILRALGRKSTVLPGGLTKLLVASLATLPRSGKVRVLGKVMQGMTAHQVSGNV